MVCPATAYDAKGLIKSAMRDNDPVIFFEHKGLYRRIKEDLPAEDYTVPIGKAKVVREGRDLTIVTYGAMVWTALEAADELAREGASIEVVDLRTLLPLDRETVCESVKKTSKVLLVHEDTRTGGMAGELAVSIAESVFEYLDAPIVRVTAPDTPVPFSPPLEEAFLPNAEKVVEKARWLLAVLRGRNFEPSLPLPYADGESSWRRAAAWVAPFRKRWRGMHQRTQEGACAIRTIS